VVGGDNPNTGTKRPLFATFDDAWAWFIAGGELESLESRRERFTQGRAQFLSFQAPVADPSALAHIAEVLDALADIEGIVPTPDEHLHISIRGAGFQVLAPTRGGTRRDDELTREEVARAGERAARSLRGIPSGEITLGPVNVFPDALILEVHDDGTLAAIRSALADVTGAADTLIDDAHYLPHVTIATFGTPECASTLRERLPQQRERPQVTMLLRRVDFARWWFTGFDDRASTELESVRSYRLT
jgi:2'-5' RNA ligase